MFRIPALALFAMAAGTLLAADGPATRYEIADLKALQRAFVDLADRVRPAVVAIRTYQLRAPGESDTRVRLPIAHGSGFIITKDGYIVTNRHVLDEADVITAVLPNGLRYRAKVQQIDMRSDLAVIRIEADNLPTVRWGDISGVKVNQWAFACGNPFGLANRTGDASVTFGVISALGREMTSAIEHDPRIQYYGNLIETTAAINPGNSGGPLFNLDGEVIGIITAIETSTGVNEGAGFAIPIDKNAHRIIETLKAGKEMRYGFLGVSGIDVDPPTSRRVADSQLHRGVKIVGVQRNGPADTAGITPEDVIIEFAGVPIESMDHLSRLVGFTPVGTDAEITYLRRHVKRKTTVTVGDRYELLGVTPDEP